MCRRRRTRIDFDDVSKATDRQNRHQNWVGDQLNAIDIGEQSVDSGAIQVLDLAEINGDDLAVGRGIDCTDRLVPG